jgi:hypothetical protein
MVPAPISVCDGACNAIKSSKSLGNILYLTSAVGLGMGAVLAGKQRKRSDGAVTRAATNGTISTQRGDM